MEENASDRSVNSRFILTRAVHHRMLANYRKDGEKKRDVHLVKAPSRNKKIMGAVSAPALRSLRLILSAREVPRIAVNRHHKDRSTLISS